MTNLQLLLARYDSLTLNTTQLAELLHMHPKSILNAVSQGRFPIPTHRVGGKRLANVTDVAAYLDKGHGA